MNIVVSTQTQIKLVEIADAMKAADSQSKAKPEDVASALVMAKVHHWHELWCGKKEEKP